MIIRSFCFCLLLGLSLSNLFALPNLKVVGLFSDAALVEIDGQRKLLKKSDIAEQGVRLIKATANYAELEVNGVVNRYTLDQGISTNYEKPRFAKVLVAKDQHDRYLTTGSINGLPVQLLVDTGATSIAMNSQTAKRLGIDYRLVGEMGQAVTASGITRSYKIMLGRVKVGDIELKQVEAAVIDGDFPKITLLGMSFLGRVTLQERRGLLELVKEY